MKAERFADPLAGVAVAGDGVDVVSPANLDDLAEDLFRTERHLPFLDEIQDAAIALAGVCDRQRHGVAAAARRIDRRIIRDALRWQDLLAALLDDAKSNLGRVD